MKAKWMTEEEFKKETKKDYNEGGYDMPFEEFYEACFQARDDDGYVKYENGKYYVYW